VKKCLIYSIAGFKDEQILTQICSVMRHHSPNSSDSFLDTGIDCGHQQLSIIDSECGHKPMYNEDGYLQIV